MGHCSRLHPKSSGSFALSSLPDAQVRQAAGVNEQVGGSRAAAGTTELLSPAGFEEELRRVARFRTRIPVTGLLDAAVRRIEANPAFAQSRLLTRILTALAYREGEFRRAELSALDVATLDIVIALMDACAAGTSPREDWVRAVDAAKAAQLGAGG